MRCSAMTALITSSLALPHAGGGDLTPSITSGCEAPPFKVSHPSDADASQYPGQAQDLTPAPW